jgi:hypothetical protein
MGYSLSEGKSIEELEIELREVFIDYPEYCAPIYGPGSFDAMVKKFANDNFFKLHLVAKAYLEKC